MNSKRELRDPMGSLMHDTDRVGAIYGFLSDVARQWVNKGMMRSCLNCEKFRETQVQPGPDGKPVKITVDLCTKYNMRPPARIIINGCRDHTDEIPF